MITDIKEFGANLGNREYWDSCGAEWNYTTIEQKIFKLAEFVQAGGNLYPVIYKYAKGRDAAQDCGEVGAETHAFQQLRHSCALFRTYREYADDGEHHTYRGNEHRRQDSLHLHSVAGGVECRSVELRLVGNVRCRRTCRELPASSQALGLLS